MGIFFIILTLTLGGVGIVLILSHMDTKFNDIKFPDSFYDDLEYFKVTDLGNVIAMKKDNVTELLYSGNPSDAKKYFNSVQKSFNDWLKRSGKTVNDKSTVNFS